MYRIAVIPGDGIGPEVIEQALLVLESLAKRFGFNYEPVAYPFGAEHYLGTGELIPEAAFQEIRACDAILLGAVGDPRCAPGVLERGIVGKLRWGLDLFVNLRPIRLFSEAVCPLKGKSPADVDMVVVRENTQGTYMGLGGFAHKGTPDEIATVEALWTRKGVERILRYAFEVAARRQRKRLHLVDKVNAIPAHDLWRRTFAELAPEFPQVSTACLYVDAAAMALVEHPEWFDVMVTTNLFGDILTDLGATIQGGIGLAASANLHPGRVSLFEPIHGSAPDLAGKGVANPLAAILAVGMMLESLGEVQAARALEAGVEGLFADGKFVDMSAQSGLTSAEIGRRVLETLGPDQLLRRTSP